METCSYTSTAGPHMGPVQHTCSWPLWELFFEKVVFFGKMCPGNFFEKVVFLASLFQKNIFFGGGVGPSGETRSISASEQT